jgi:hypothetical protein
LPKFLPSVFRGKCQVLIGWATFWAIFFFKTRLVTLIATFCLFCFQAKLGDLWSASHMGWEQFVPKDQLDEFFKSNVIYQSVFICQIRA